MGQPAAVMGDAIKGVCAVHQIPNPASGVPQPAPPMPFNAPITTGTSSNVLISGKPAATVGSSGLNVPPHIGLHATDLFALPTMQKGRVVGGSTSVLIGGKPAAKTGSSCTMCAAAPAQIVGSATSVLIGG